MNVLRGQDVLVLGFMTFALSVGAGNIIFPPVADLQSGSHAWLAAPGFLITAVGLPVTIATTLTKIGGSVNILSHPIGEYAGDPLAAVRYLAAGPLFAIPRTVTVSFKAGVMLLLGESGTALFVYNPVYSLPALTISLYPDRLLGTAGCFPTPLKILALVTPGVAILLWPAGPIGTAQSEYTQAVLSQDSVDDYLTMDTLAALVFDIVIINTIHSRGTQSPRLITRHVIVAGLVAGIGLMLVYVSLFRSGADSHVIAADASNGAAALYAYVQHTFGNLGSSFLTGLIALAYLVTTVGLTCAYAKYFCQHLPPSCRSLMIILAGFPFIVFNLGLTKLIQVPIPVLTVIYPLYIVLVALSFYIGL